MSSLLTKPLVQHHLSRVSPIQLRDFPLEVFVEVFGAFGLTISESQTETMCMPIPLAPATKIVLQRHGATVPPDNLLHLPGSHND